VIVAVIFLVIAVWGILTSDAGDHSLQHGMIVGCGLLVVVVVVGDLIRRRTKHKSGTTLSKQ
jgi:hypothetical protein